MANIYFGKWEPHQKLLNQRYHKLVDKIVKFAHEAGPDPCKRQFAAEPLIDFVIFTGITDKSVDYMYRHYVYHKLAKMYQLDVDKLELDDLYTEFALFPENVRVKLAQ